MILNVSGLQPNCWETHSKPTPNQAIGILENAKITVPLKYLNNFWRSLCH